MLTLRFALLPVGAGCLLFGIKTLRGGLAALPGDALAAALKRLCAGPLRAFAFGAAAAAALQSSSAVTVALMALAADGAVSQKRAVAVLLGANLGTTCTAQLLRGGAGGPGLAPAKFWPVLLLAGLVVPAACPGRGGLAAGKALGGLALLFCGLRAMAAGAAPLMRLPATARLFGAFADPVAGFTAGALGAAALQSSTAAVAMLQALSAGGALYRGAAAASVLGQNLGSCLPAALAAPGGGVEGGRVAAANLLVNLLGGLFGAVLLYPARGAFAAWYFSPSSAAFIANFHTLYNLASSLLFLPLSGPVAALCAALVPGDRSAGSGPAENLSKE